MKTLYCLLASVAMAAASSCTAKVNIQENISPAAELIPMTIGGSMENTPQIDEPATRTVYKNRMVLWEETDAISVFFKSGNESAVKQTFTVKELADENATAIFEGLGVENAETTIGVYPDRSSNSYDGTAVTVTIPTEQTGVLNGFDPAANVSVACAGQEGLLFKNVGSLIGFRFATQEEAAQVASVTIRAKSEISGQYIGISGSSKVTLQQDGTPVAGGASADYVTINAPEGGFAVDNGLQYFAAVYPFESKGLEVTFTLKDGETLLLENDNPVSLSRNQGLSLYTLSVTAKLPDEFEVKLNFAKGWPFKEGIRAKADQINTGGGYGDEYTYEYQYQNGGKTYSTDLKFHIYGNGGNYEFISPNILKTASKNARILLPAISGRHLKSVKVEVTNGAAYPKAFNIMAMGWNVLVNGPGAHSGAPGVVTFPYDYVRTEKNTPYFLQFAAASTSVSAITLTYSKTLNEGSTSEPDGHFSLMQMTNAGYSQMMAYILKTDTGKVIVIDGGNAGEDTAKMRKLLAEKYGNHVYMWWITHPHTDHIGVLNEILDDKQGLEIDYIMHSRFSTTHLKRERVQGETVTEFYAKLDALTDTKVIGNIDSGAHYDIDGVCIDVLGVTNEEITVNPYNNSSMILRFEDKDKTVLFLADAGEECGDKAIKKYRDLLDCDYIQMAHHGQKGVREEFYKAISFKACLWPTPKWLWDAAEGNANDFRTWQTRQWMNEKGIQEHHVVWEEIDWFLE